MEKKSKLTVICSGGDPRNFSTWSGTPANLVAALERLGVEVAALNSQTHSWALTRLSHRLMSKRGAAHAPKAFSPIGRLNRGANALRQLEVEKSAAALFIGTLGLPALRKPQHQRWGLLIDTTFKQALRYSLDTMKWPYLMQSVSNALDKQAYSQIDHFFAISEHVAESLQADYGIASHRITIAGTGRGIITPYYGEKDYARGSMLFVGKQRPDEKGAHLLLQAFDIARQQLPWMKLRMIGRPEFSELASKHPGVTGEGHVSVDELQSAFEQAAFFAMPALYEPWGLVYLEALATRTPIIGLRRLSLPEITSHGRYGYLADHAAPEALAGTILQAYASPDTARTMGQTGQKAVLAQYQWDKVAERVAARFDLPIQRS